MSPSDQPPTGGDPRDEIRWLRLRLDHLTRRLEAIEQQVARTGIQVEATAEPPPPAPCPAGPSATSQPEPPVPTPTQPSVPAAKAIILESVSVPPPAAAPPVSPPPVVPPARSMRAASLEQRIGVSWFSKLGILAVVLAAGFFFKYAVDQGWVGKPVRCVIVTVGGLFLLGLGEWTLRKAWRVISAGLTAGGIVLLYAAAYAASPRFYDLVSTEAAFALMCLTTVLAVALSLRSHRLSTAIMAMVGAFLTPVLLSSGRDEQTVLVIYLLVIDAGFLTLATLKRWRALVPIAWAGTGILYTAWMVRFYAAPDQATVTTLFAWALFLVLAGHVVFDVLRRRAPCLTNAILVTVGSAVMMTWIVAIWAEHGHHVPLVNVLLLTGLALAFSCWREWHWPRPIVWGQVALVMLVPYAADAAGWRAPWVIAPWVWAFGALFLADVLVRSWRAVGHVAYQISLASVTVAALFGAVYGVLKPDYDHWMGVYTAALAVGALGLAALLHRRRRPRALVYALVCHGLVLITVAMAVQFDKHALTIAWAAQAAVSIALARRLASKTMLVTGFLVLYLAVGHFALIDVPTDRALEAPLFVLEGKIAQVALLLVLGLAAAAYACAGLMRWGRAITDDASDATVAHIFLWTGTLTFFVGTQMHLPSLWACWAWWVLAMAVAAVMALRGGAGGLVAAAFHLLIVGGRWLVWDTMELRLIQGAEIDRMPLLNKQFLLGVAVAAALVWFLRIVRRRLGSEADWAPRLAGAMLAVAVVLPVWGASFEVDRYTVGHGADFADWQLARQMGWSILWAVYAGGLIAGGFALRQVIVRYVAIGILALTIGKVLLVDMAGVGAVYRILSFLALGAVLVAASLIYQRHFGRRADASGTGDEPEAPGP